MLLWFLLLLLCFCFSSLSSFCQTIDQYDLSSFWLPSKFCLTRLFNLIIGFYRVLKNSTAKRPTFPPMTLRRCAILWPLSQLSILYGRLCWVVHGYGFNCAQYQFPTSFHPSRIDKNVRLWAYTIHLQQKLLGEKWSFGAGWDKMSCSLSTLLSFSFHCVQIPLPSASFH